MAASSADVLSAERLRPLWVAAHRRLEATGGRLTGAAVHLRDLTEEQRAAVCLAPVPWEVGTGPTRSSRRPPPGARRAAAGRGSV